MWEVCSVRCCTHISQEFDPFISCGLCVLHALFTQGYSKKPTDGHDANRVGCPHQPARTVHGWKSTKAKCEGCAWCLISCCFQCFFLSRFVYCFEGVHHLSALGSAGHFHKVIDYSGCLRFLILVMWSCFGRLSWNFNLAVCNTHAAVTNSATPRLRLPMWPSWGNHKNIKDTCINEYLLFVRPLCVLYMAALHLNGNLLVVSLYCLAHTAAGQEMCCEPC